MSNKDIADVLTHGENALTIADSAEPKSIDEIASYGVSILPSQKGQGSVNQGVQYVQDQVIYVTRRSLNLLKEYKNYMWLTDKDGKIINEPQDFMNHCLDAGRYAMESLKPRDENITTQVRQHNIKAISKWSIG
jgi:phage terminase large subunit